jgi:hypothetical protein
MVLCLDLLELGVCVDLLLLNAHKHKLTDALYSSIETG